MSLVEILTVAMIAALVIRALWEVLIAGGGPFSH